MRSVTEFSVTKVTATDRPTRKSPETGRSPKDSPVGEHRISAYDETHTKSENTHSGLKCDTPDSNFCNNSQPLRNCIIT
jgi:hypothetical protein